MIRSWAVAAIAGVLLAGCSESDDDTTKADPTPSAQATVDPREPACAYLSPAQRKDLVGSAIDQVVATSGSGDSSQCRWQSDDALVQVTSLPAKEWARTLPDVIAQLEKTGAATARDKRDLARAKKLLSDAGEFTDRQACEAFSTLAEIGGAPKGAATTVTAVPVTQSETGLSAQTCSSGELTSLLYSVPGLEETKQTRAAVTTALAAAQKRAVAAG